MIKDLPEKLKSLRKQYKYSQKNVAEKLCVSPAIISAYETGERTPSTENILALSRLYHCSTDYLLGKETETVGLYVDIGELSTAEIHAVQTIIEGLRKK